MYLAYCRNCISVFRFGNSAKEHSELSIGNNMDLPEDIVQYLSTGCLYEVKNQTGPFLLAAQNFHVSSYAINILWY